MRVGEKKSFAIMTYLLNQRIADGVIQNESITLTSRRMVKDEYIRNIRTKAGSLGGNPALKPETQKYDLLNQSLVNQNPTPSSSSSTSSLNKEKEILSCKPDPIPFTSIISYLNSKTKKNFSPKTKLYQQHIRARWHEGKREPDFQKVVDIKCAKWLTDEKMVDFCRPETLFGSKMDSYLQEGTNGDGGTILDPVERIRQIRLRDEADRAAAADAGKTRDRVGIREDES